VARSSAEDILFDVINSQPNKPLITISEKLNSLAFIPAYFDINFMIKTNRKLAEMSNETRTLAEKISNITHIKSTDTSSPFRRYIVRNDSIGKILVEQEASGYTKFALLFQLLTNGWLEKNSVLLWDEPENSLNPELMPKLVEILLELSRSGVQIFLATHSKFLANEFNVSSNEDDNLKYFSLYKDETGVIKAATGKRFEWLNPNKLTETSIDQYDREIDKELGDED
jgi:AAA15 family ATPase/GTPase